MTHYIAMGGEYDNADNWPDYNIIEPEEGDYIIEST